MINPEYDALKRKYDALLEENKRLKARLGELTDKSANHIRFPEPAQASPGISDPILDSEFTDVKFPRKSPITKYSHSHEKIDLFISLFKGRRDVYAKKWRNRKGNTGYSPVCLNEWKPGLCCKPAEKCSKCTNQAYDEFSDLVVEKHLTGECVIGIYPMHLDETCHFLAIDFDNEGWEKDVNVIRRICSELNIPVAVERSQSGHGCHAWFFFEHNLSAALARRFGTSLLTYGMNRRHEISFKSYDRLFPNQDTMPKGGLGNLIALPLQKAAREKNNTVFIDENLIPHPDQWQFLSNLQRLTQERLTLLITQLNQGNELGILKEDTSESKPWQKRSADLNKQDFPETVKIVKSGMLYIEKKGLSQKALNTLKRCAAFQNPEFYKAQAMRLSTYGKPRIVSCADDYKNYLALPRGCKEDVESLIASNNASFVLEDETNSGKKIDVSFNGKLRDEQEDAFNALVNQESGVLAATPAFGKTVIAAKLIGAKKVNTLILVHRKQLLSQWCEKLEQFLIVNESLPEKPKGRGRKKEIHIVGHISAGKDRLNSIVDIAVMQSLYTKGNVKDVIQNYGMIIIDECHHVPAVTFEQILKQATARIIYGLTATPARSDGHHPIIFFYCGPVRFSVDSRKQAAKRPFDHYLVPRFTSFKIPSCEEAISLQEIKNRLLSDEVRNQKIVEDVVACYKKGRKSLILTGRIAHVEALGETLKTKLPNVICLTGGMGVQKTTQVINHMKSIKSDEPFVLIATGSYIGEGFDEARLDTLFLAMPIAWKGTLQQYAGRLHRLHINKKDVQIYDYVDLHVHMLEKMYHKRLRGYASIGYMAKVSSLPDVPPHNIFSKDDFRMVYLRDIDVASKHILIVSPFITKKRIIQMMPRFNVLLKKEVKITIITRPAKDYNINLQNRIHALLSMIDIEGVTLIFKSKIHQKFAVIDHQITWYGSINLLSFGHSEESIMRLESSSIACELEGSLK